MARPSDTSKPPEQPLPQGIRDVLARRPRPRDGDNLGLWLDKLLPLDPDTYDLTKEPRERLLGDIFVAQDDLGASRPWRSRAASEALERLRASCRLLYGENFRELKAELNGRLLLDYARVSTIESSISLHATLGVPRLTGSSLKGLLRASLRNQITPDKLGILLGAPDLEDSGTRDEHRRGRLVIHDALPEDGRFQLDLDVLTPHFGEYYRDERTPPADWLSPVPVTFLTVVKTTFRLFIGLLPDAGCSDVVRHHSNLPADERDLDRIATVLAEALREEGLGAKRSAGYGRFKASKV